MSVGNASTKFFEGPNIRGSLYFGPPRALPPREPECITLASLSDHKKALVWEHIKQHEPQMKAQLRSQEYRSMVEAFGASLVVTREFVDKATKGRV